MSSMQSANTDTTPLGTILGIWAHPDDECWAMAGLMAMARVRGQRVVCATATTGEAGQTADEARWPTRDLRAIRRRECEAALEHLGVAEHEWLDYADGKLSAANQAEAVAKLADIIARVRPDSIFTFEPEGITGHDDHKTISAWTVAAAKRVAPSTPVYGAVQLHETYETAGKRLHETFNMYFNTPKPVTVTPDEAALCLHLPDDIVRKKLESLQLQPSQMSRLFADPDAAADVRTLFASEAFLRLRYLKENSS